MMVERVLSIARGASALAIVGFVVLSCVPSPKNVPCSNLGDCKKVDERFGFCSTGKCVECVGRGSCEGHDCVEGMCEIPCNAAGRCDQGRVCQAGKCVYADWT